MLRQAIPGCEELIQHSPTELEATVVLKIGPVKARFKGNVILDTAAAPAGPPPKIRALFRRTGISQL